MAGWPPTDLGEGGTSGSELATLRPRSRVDVLHKRKHEGWSSACLKPASARELVSLSLL